MKEKLLEINPDGKWRGTWDLLLWKGQEIKFVELKRKGKDKIKQAQIDFFERALNVGYVSGNFEFYEWEEIE
jgi:hypothetical protein